MKEIAPAESQEDLRRRVHCPVSTLGQSPPESSGQVRSSCELAVEPRVSVATEQRFDGAIWVRPEEGRPDYSFEKGVGGGAGGRGIPPGLPGWREWSPVLGRIGNTPGSSRVGALGLRGPGSGCPAPVGGLRGMLGGTLGEAGGAEGAGCGCGSRGVFGRGSGIGGRESDRMVAGTRTPGSLGSCIAGC